MEDPDRVAYRARMAAWVDIDPVSGLKLEFEPIKTHLAKRGAAVKPEARSMTDPSTLTIGLRVLLCVRARERRTWASISS